MRVFMPGLPILTARTTGCETRPTPTWQPDRLTAFPIEPSPPIDLFIESDRDLFLNEETGATLWRSWWPQSFNPNSWTCAVKLFNRGPFCPLTDLLGLEKLKRRIFLTSSLAAATVQIAMHASITRAFWTDQALGLIRSARSVPECSGQWSGLSKSRDP